MKNARSGIERARFVDQFVFVITLSKAALGRGGDAGPSDGGQGHLPGLLHGYPPPVCGRGNGPLGIYPGGDPGRGAARHTTCPQTAALHRRGYRQSSEWKNRRARRDGHRLLGAAGQEHKSLNLSLRRTRPAAPDRYTTEQRESPRRACRISCRPPGGPLYVGASRLTAARSRRRGRPARSRRPTG